MHKNNRLLTLVSYALMLIAIAIVVCFGVVEAKGIFTLGATPASKVLDAVIFLQTLSFGVMAIIFRVWKKTNQVPKWYKRPISWAALLHVAYIFTQANVFTYFIEEANLDFLDLAWVSFTAMGIIEIINFSYFFIDVYNNKPTRWFLRTWPYAAAGILATVYTQASAMKDFETAKSGIGIATSFLVITYFGQIFNERLCPKTQGIDTSH